MTRSAYCVGVEQRGRSRPGSASFSTIIQLPCGSVLTASGLSLSAVFTSTTSPDTGAYSSDTALTDSIVPNDCPASSVVPDVRQLDVDDVAELLLRVVGDADLAAIAGQLDPLVVFRVLEAGRIRHVALTRQGPSYLGLCRL